MMVVPLKCMCTVSEMSNAHACMLPKYLACSAHAPMSRSWIRQLSSWIRVKGKERG